MITRVYKIVLVIMVLCSISVVSLSCGSESDSAVSENQTAIVQRGNLAVEVTASGNLELSITEDLAFEISGTVAEVLVEEGDSVEEGQLLAKLDASEWDDMLRELERDLLQAEISLENAEVALDEAEEKDKLVWMETDDGIIMGTVSSRTTVDHRDVEMKELRVKLAQDSFEDAREALDEALESSPEIIAPFDGFITAVNVDGGDEVKTGTVAVVIADPNKFEADILVSEMDILQVKLEGEAWVQVDVMEGMSLPAKVTHISPTATIQSGVVNYEVKVEVESLEAVMQERQQTRQEAMERIMQGELPEYLKQAIEEGRITQEEAEERMKQMQQGQGGQQRQVPTAVPENFQLREGLTITVSIIVDEKNDVLLVPDGAITRQGGETYVKVLLADGATEQRLIQAGITNGQFTEVVDGLSEGEKVVVPEGTTTTTPTQQRRGPPRGMIPGMRRMLR